MRRVVPFMGLALATVLFVGREAAAQEETPPVRPTDHLRRAVVLRLDGGYASRRLYELPITGGAAGIGFGFERRWVVHTVSFHGTVGSTEHGLGVRSGHFMYDADFTPFDRFRFGFGGGLMLLGVDRAARNDSIMSWGPTIRVSARVDVFKPEGFTLFARASIDYAAALKGDDADFWGPTIGLGVDFDLSSSKPRP